MTKKGPGRPKSQHKRQPVGYRFSDETRQALDDIVARLKDEAPAYMEVTQRMVLEALVHKACRDASTYSDLFGVLQEK